MSLKHVQLLKDSIEHKHNVYGTWLESVLLIPSSPLQQATIFAWAYASNQVKVTVKLRKYLKCMTKRLPLLTIRKAINEKAYGS